MSCCSDPSCRNGSLCNPTPGNDDRVVVYTLRARSYEQAADKLDSVTEEHLAIEGMTDRYFPVDPQVRTTLDTIAAELHETADHWRWLLREAPP